MPSPSADRDGPRTAVVLVVLAVLAASLPATVVGSAAGIGTDATLGVGTHTADSETTGDRATCTRSPGPTGAMTVAENATSPPTPNETEDLAVARGDVAVVPLSVPAGANATVTVGSDEGYTADLTVRDDGDGRVTLLVNTYLVGNRTTVAPGAYRTLGADEAAVVGGSPTSPLDAGEYPVTVRRNGSLVGERQLTVTEPSVESVTPLRAVPRLFDVADASDVRAANRSGLVRPLRPGEYGPEVVSGETLLLRIDAPSLLGVVAAQPGNTTTERFLALHDETAPETNETFTIFGPCGGILFPDTVAEGGARVLLDYREGAVYVLLDTDDLEGLDDGKQTAHVDVVPESRIGSPDEGRQLTAEFLIGERRTSIRPAADAVELSAVEGATITGETSLLPGSRVPVRVESRVDPSFERRTTATVADDGTFTATVDLANASNPGVFAVEVGRERFPGEIGDPPDIYWELDQFEEREEVSEFPIERLAVPIDGLLVAYRYDSATGRFRPVGSADATHDDLSVETLAEPQYLLLVAHRDANGNAAFDGPTEDPPYRVGGQAVSDWFGVTVGGVEPPETEPSARFDAGRVTTPTAERPTTRRYTSTTPDATVETTALDGSETASASENRSGDASDLLDADVPGFGLLVALVALFGVASLLRRGRR